MTIEKRPRTCYRVEFSRLQAGAGELSGGFGRASIKPYPITKNKTGGKEKC